MSFAFDLEKLIRISGNLTKPAREYPDPTKIESIGKILSKKVDTISAVPKNVDLSKLDNKLHRKFRGIHETFTLKEMKNLPFLLEGNAGEMGMTEFVFREINIHRPSIFRRVLYTYFRAYIPNHKAYEYMKIQIVSELKRDPGKVDRIRFLQNDPRLLSGGPEQLAVDFQGDIFAYLKRIEFPDVLYSGRFVGQAIMLFFNRGKHSAEVLVQNVRNGEFLLGQNNLFPYIADSLILTVDQSGKDDYINLLIKIFYKYMNDPRHPEGKIKWRKVSSKAQNVFLSWLKKNDFEIFFGIIEKTAGRTAAGDRMWKYRQQFWEDYLDDMYETRVILGFDAVELAHEMGQKLLNCAYLSRGSHDQSLLMFSIGRFVFIEVSHSGKLRIFLKNQSPIPFYESRRNASYSYSEIREFYAVEEFIHSSPETYSWQSRVSEWIRMNCGINPKRRYYRHER